MTPTQRTSVPRISENTEYVVREVRTEAELAGVLALRYEVYRRTAGVAHLTSIDHATGLDMDAYDLHSHHLALFARTEGHEEVVGTLRITGPELGPMTRELHAIAIGHPTLASHLAARRPAPLPMLSYIVQAPAVSAVVDACLGRGERIAEPGRLTVHPALRVAAARTGLRLSHFLITGALAVGWHVLGLDRVFLDCDANNGSLYRRFGFAIVPGGDATPQPALGFTILVLQATPADLPGAFRAEVDRIANQLAIGGEATLAPTAVRPRVAASSRSLPAPAAGAWVPATA